jgi:hypothetical protein
MNVEDGDADFCPRCGAPLERELRASNGGEPLDEGALFERISNGQSFHGDFHGSKTDGGYPMGGDLPITRAVIYLHEEDAEPHEGFEPEPLFPAEMAVGRSTSNLPAGQRQRNAEPPQQQREQNMRINQR